MNTLSNLDWVIFECILKWQNINNIKTYTEAKCKPVICIDDDMEFISAQSCAEFYKISNTTISKVCTNKTHFVHCINKSFKFKENNEFKE